MTPEEAEVRKKIFDESKRYRDPDCFVLGAGYGSGVFADLYRKDGIDKFKLALREEVDKMIEKEPTDNDRIYPNEKAAIEAYEKVLEKLDSLTPKK